MKVKTYYSETVEAAIAKASKELGPDAMLLNSRRTPPESKHLGEYEVVLALSASEGGGFDAELARAGGIDTPPQNMDRLTREIADLRRQIERTASMFRKSGTLAGAPITQNPALLRLFSGLVTSDVDPELAHDVISSCAATGSGDDTLQLEIARLLAVSPSLGSAGAEPAVAAFIGPPGAGKTSVLVKLAVRYGIARRKRVHLISLDTERIGGADQLRTFAALLGVGVEVLDDPRSLEASLTACRHRDLVLIDTPGLIRERIEESRDLMCVLTAQRVDIHLVLPVSAKAADLSRTASAWEVFGPSKLIFTRLDETDTYGAILNEVVRTGHPVSFVSSGQKIPDDIEAADVNALASLITGSRLSSGTAAAAA
jgi:flagellar biosynthesis protein FlhF